MPTAPRPSPESASPFRSLAELLSDPATCAPPQAVIPRLGWQGRTTLLAGREKGGKSTLLGCAAACVSAGAHFLDGHCLRGPVLWVGLEEHVSDIAGRFQRFGADPAKVFIADRLARPFEELEAAAEHLRPVLVVVDTLAAFVEGKVETPECFEAEREHGRSWARLYPLIGLLVETPQGSGRLVSALPERAVVALDGQPHPFAVLPTEVKPLDAARYPEDLDLTIH